MYYYEIETKPMKKYPNGRFISIVSAISNVEIIKDYLKSVYGAEVETITCKDINDRIVITRDIKI